MRGLRIGPREGVLLGANLGRVIVTNGDMGTFRRMCATGPRRGPLHKLLWADLFMYKQVEQLKNRIHSLATPCDLYSYKYFPASPISSQYTLV